MEDDEDEDEDEDEDDEDDQWYIGDRVGFNLFQIFSSNQINQPFINTLMFFSIFDA
jgi:hypothetical protein